MALGLASFAEGTPAQEYGVGHTAEGVDGASESVIELDAGDEEAPSPAVISMDLFSLSMVQDDDAGFAGAETEPVHDLAGVLQSHRAIEGRAISSLDNHGPVGAEIHSTARVELQDVGIGGALVQVGSLEAIHGVRHLFEQVGGRAASTIDNDGEIGVQGHARGEAAVEADELALAVVDPLAVSGLSGIESRAIAVQEDSDTVLANTGWIGVAARAESVAAATAENEGAFVEIEDVEVEGIAGIVSFQTMIGAEATSVIDQAGEVEVLATGSGTAVAQSPAGAGTWVMDRVRVADVAGLVARIDGAGQAGVSIIDNTGSVSVDASAASVAVSESEASTEADTDGATVTRTAGVVQILESPGDDGLAVFDNAGDLQVQASSRSVTIAESPSGEARADTGEALTDTVGGVSQDLTGVAGSAVSLAANSGTLNLEVGASSVSIAAAGEPGELGEPDEPDVDVIALAQADEYAELGEAVALLRDAAGIAQFATEVEEDAEILAINAGELRVVSEVEARSIGASEGELAAGSAQALGLGVGAIGQELALVAGDAQLVASNEGLISLRGQMEADAQRASDGAQSVSGARASLTQHYGIAQGARDVGGELGLQAHNAGELRLDTQAKAHMLANSAGQDVDAANPATHVNGVRGIRQDVWEIAEGTRLEAGNQGHLVVAAQAESEVIARADGVARAENTGVLTGQIHGLWQRADATTGLTELVADNSGDLQIRADARAHAEAEGARAEGEAGALVVAVSGVRQTAMRGGEARLHFENSGRLGVQATVSARAHADDGARADASARQVFGVLQSALDRERGEVGLSNTGDIDVAAVAENGGIDGEVAAEATGVAQGAGGFLGPTAPLRQSLTNQGRIRALAMAPGGEAIATAVHVAGGPLEGGIVNAGAAAEISAHADGTTGGWVTAIEFGDAVVLNDTFEILNDSGVISATWSEHGSETLRHGTAVDLSGVGGAPVVLSLQGSEGDGTLVGDVTLRSNDRVEVSAGTTRFSGVVNPDTARLGGFALTAGGELVLQRHAEDGAASVHVERFAQDAGSTLALELGAHPGGGTMPAGAEFDFVGRIDAEQARLAGDLEIHAAPGLHAAHTRYAGVAMADSGTGAWDTLTLSTPLLQAELDYRGGSDSRWSAVDLEVSRVAFDAVDGLRGNRRAVAGALERSYAGLLGGAHADTGYAGLVGGLFTLDAGGYTQATRQLAGGEYAQGLRSLTGSLDLYRRTVTERTGWTATSGEDEGVWFHATRTRGEVDGDHGAPGFDHDRESTLLGIDQQVAPDLRVGAALGYYGADLGFDGGASRLDYDGIQAGLYGQHEWGAAYLRGHLGLGLYRGDAVRSMDAVAAPGPVQGRFRARAWNAGAEFGHAFELGGGTHLIPYAGLDYEYARLGSFAERGETGAELELSGSHARVTSDLGVRLARQVELSGERELRMDLRAGWLHGERGRSHAVDAAFSEIEGSEFVARGSGTSRDRLALDATLALVLGERGELGAGYAGRLGSDVTEHQFMLRGLLRF
ncbi:MAG: autotransporter domain-containing protein [Pseudomonadota bacterium]